MNKDFNFEKWQPPILTEAQLRKVYKERQKRRVLLVMFTASFLNTLLMAALFAIACRYSKGLALGILILLAVSLVCMGVTVVVFTIKRRDLIYEL